MTPAKHTDRRDSVDIPAPMPTTFRPKPRLIDFCEKAMSAMVGRDEFRIVMNRFPGGWDIFEKVEARRWGMFRVITEDILYEARGQFTYIPTTTPLELSMTRLVLTGAKQLTHPAALDHCSAGLDSSSGKLPSERLGTLFLSVKDWNFATISLAV